jgi:hypothetical protein
MYVVSLWPPRVGPAVSTLDHGQAGLGAERPGEGAEL